VTIPEWPKHPSVVLTPDYDAISTISLYKHPDSAVARKGSHLKGTDRGTCTGFPSGNQRVPNFIPTNVGTSNFVRDPFDLRLGQHFAYESEFGVASLLIV
jgi:hypothetical protein